MQAILDLYRASFAELKKVKSVTLTAMLMALSVILGYFTIEAGPYLKIGFSTLVNQFVCFLFGPVVGIIYNGLLDILKYMVKPTGPFFPGFTLNAMLAGLIIVPLVSIFTKAPDRALVDDMFDCYNTMVTVPARETLGDGE